MSKKVYGEYPNMHDAEAVVENLIQGGVPASSILVLSNQTVDSSLVDAGIAADTIGSDHHTLWQRFKHFFGAENYTDFEGTILGEYKDDISAGNTLVFVEENYLPNLANEVIQNDSGKLSVHLPEKCTNEDLVKLVQEHLSIDKQSVESGEVRFKKIVKETNETVTVPVMHEELVIEKVAPGCNTGCNISADDFKEQEYIIPLMEERVSVNKVPVVTAEYRIGKKIVENTKQVSDTVRSEELDEVDARGKVLSVKY